HARVDVHLDGQHLGQYGANGIRDDVATAFPLLGRYVGFDHTIQVGAWGDHEVCLDLLHAQDAGLVTSLGCRTLYIAPVAPLGNLEALTSADEQIVVEGWAGHPDGTPGATVTIRVDGALAATTTADRPRGDVHAAKPQLHTHTGFAAVVPTNPGGHEVCIRALNLDPARPDLDLGCHQLEVVAVPPIGELESAVVDVESRSLTVAGWAGDPLGHLTNVTVEISASGRLLGPLLASGPRPDIESEHPGLDATTGFGGEFELGPGHHEICAVAVDPPDRREPLGCLLVDPILANSFVAVTPTRVIDTRVGPGRLAANGQLTLPLEGVAGVPEDAVVALAVTATGASGRGFVTVHRCVEQRPLVSSMNFGPGVSTTNLVMVGTGAGSALCAFSNVETHLIVDLVGWWPLGVETTAIVPTRLLDTRTDAVTTQVLAAGQTVVMDITTPHDVPDSGVGAVALHVASTGAPTDGFVTVWPCDAAQRPVAANLNHPAGTTVSNLVLSEVAEDGSVCLFTSAGGELIVDVQAWWPATSTYHPVVPDRVLDTRSPSDATGGLPVGSGEIVRLDLSAHPALVGQDVSAVALEVAATQARGKGHLVVWDCATPRPAAASLTYGPDRTTATLVLGGVGADGTVCLFAYSATHLVADLQGWWDLP
ncbi:MAG: hypothetical protein KDB21_11790, partial [Acidimicrobiales bacterium]|nr:hypothetical protein [Acidimicrobiales bacterium]